MPLAWIRALVNGAATLTCLLAVLTSASGTGGLVIASVVVAVMGGMAVLPTLRPRTQENAAPACVGLAGLVIVATAVGVTAPSPGGQTVTATVSCILLALLGLALQLYWPVDARAARAGRHDAPADVVVRLAVGLLAAASLHFALFPDIGQRFALFSAAALALLPAFGRRSAAKSVVGIAGYVSLMLVALLTSGVYAAFMGPFALTAAMPCCGLAIAGIVLNVLQWPADAPKSEF
jgi:hypothetical protein